MDRSRRWTPMFGTVDNLGTVKENENSIQWTEETEILDTIRPDDIPVEKEEDMRYYNFKPKAYNIKAKTLTKVNFVHASIAQR